MKNGLKFSRLGVMALLSLSLLACGGDGDGGGNDVGKEVIVPVVDVAERALVTINSVAENADHTVTIHFSATNENDIALLGLSEPRFTVAKLVPEQDGKPSEWVSLINKSETNSDTGLKALQATYDRDSKNEEGRFTDNGNGTYSFKLKETVLTAVNPLTGASIAWDANATHRVGMQVSGNANNVLNATYDWVPSGAGLVDARDIVDTATCNNCHGELKLHGSRVETKYCVTCHNPGSTDAGSGNSVDFTPMIHKIHRGANLPSMAAYDDGGKGDGAVYEIIGYKDKAHTYAKNDADDISGVKLPQDIRNCSNCHTGDNEVTPQGDNWKTNASVTACTSCHDDIAFSQEEIDSDLNLSNKTWKREHPNGFVEADSCTNCHSVNSGNTSPEYPHEIVRNQAKAAADLLEISFVGAERVAAGLKIDVQINYDGAAVPDFAAFAATYINNTVYEDDGTIKTPAKGYLLVNADTGNGYTKSYGEVNINLNDCAPQGAGLFICTVTTITETGTLSLMTSDMPLCANAKSSTPELIACTSAPTSYVQVETVPAKHVEAFYDLDDGVALDTLASVSDYVEKIGADITGCMNCHADDGLHMGDHPHAATDLAQCTNCHNATRASYYAGRPADLKSHVHTLHANNDSSHPMDSYPGNIATCTSCHTDNQYDLPLTANKRSSNARTASFGEAFVSPMVTVCASCHIKDMPVGLIAADGTMDETRKAGLSADDIAANEKVIAHMTGTTGGLFGQATMADADAAPEQCAGCHAKGEAKGVDVTHGL